MQVKRQFSSISHMQHREATISFRWPPWADNGWIPRSLASAVQPMSFTSQLLTLLPNPTSWRQTHVCVNNLATVVARSRTRHSMIRDQICYRRTPVSYRWVCVTRFSRGETTYCMEHIPRLRWTPGMKAMHMKKTVSTNNPRCSCWLLQRQTAITTHIASA